MSLEIKSLIDMIHCSKFWSCVLLKFWAFNLQAYTVRRAQFIWTICNVKENSKPYSLYEFIQAIRKKYWLGLYQIPALHMNQYTWQI